MKEVVLTMLQTADEALHNTKIRLAEELEQAHVERKRVLDAAQSLCLHEEKRKEYDFNPHTRDEWTRTYCSICDKYLFKE